MKTEVQFIELLRLAVSASVTGEAGQVLHAHKLGSPRCTFVWRVVARTLGWVHYKAAARHNCSYWRDIPSFPAQYLRLGDSDQKQLLMAQHFRTEFAQIPGRHASVLHDLYSHHASCGKLPRRARFFGVLYLEFNRLVYTFSPFTEVIFSFIQQLQVVTPIQLLYHPELVLQGEVWYNPSYSCSSLPSQAHTPEECALYWLHIY